jgi:hypothetical protein
MDTRFERHEALEQQRMATLVRTSLSSVFHSWCDCGALNAIVESSEALCPAISSRRRFKLDRFSILIDWAETIIAHRQSKAPSKARAIRQTTFKDSEDRDGGPRIGSRGRDHSMHFRRSSNQCTFNIEDNAHGSPFRSESKFSVMYKSVTKAMLGDHSEMEEVMRCEAYWCFPTCGEAVIHE